MIRDYFSEVENILSSCTLTVDFNFDFTVIDTNKGFWKASLTFRDGSELHLFEFLEDNNIEKYRYHFQDSENQLVFRYDNAPHHPEIETHPDHIHTSNDKIESSEKPSLEKVLEKAIENLVD